MSLSTAQIRNIVNHAAFRHRPHNALALAPPTLLASALKATLGRSFISGDGAFGALWNPFARVGRAGLFYPAGNEGRTGVVRHHHAVGRPRYPGGDPLETGDPLCDRTHSCAEADPVRKHPAQRG